MTRKSDTAARELRRKQVAANLLAGLNYREMAEALDVSLGTIRNDVALILKRWQQEQVAAAGDYVSLAERRLDRALNAIWGDVLDGDLRAITVLVKLEERRARLRGMDQPDKLEHSGSVEQRRHDPLEGLDDDARRKLIDNLIRARGSRSDPGHGPD